MRGTKYEFIFCFIVEVLIDLLVLDHHFFVVLEEA
jgi:hypothetical protein